MVTLLGNIISMSVVALLFLSLLLPKKIHYFASGLTLISLGALPLLYDLKFIGINIAEYPVINYAAYFLVVLAAKDLLIEGFKEKESPLRIPSIILALTLLLLTSLPTLNKLRAIDFVLEYPPLIDQILYMLCGLFLIIGIFTILKRKE
ncbi:hypothetical protein KY345_02160 [Candidatus Woesearchaeota archaeon]|nr:hypothetical protein [Candidatus Woesearchaeota archaeon]